MSISWSDLRSFGNSKVVTSNYFWIFIIPLLTVNVDKLSTHLGVDFEVPFSVSKFFYASLCFAVGTLIYQFRCPLIVKHNSSLSSFEAEGKTVQHVIDYLQQSSEKLGASISCGDISNVINEFDKGKDVNSKVIVKIKKGKGAVESAFVDVELRAELFWTVYDKLNNQFKISIYLCFLFYLSGLIFLFITGIINVFYALELFLCK